MTDWFTGARGPRPDFEADTGSGAQTGAGADAEAETGLYPQPADPRALERRGWDPQVPAVQAPEPQVPDPRALEPRGWDPQFRDPQAQLPQVPGAQLSGLADTAPLVQQLLGRARYLRLTVAVAESLTGGQLAAAITAVPGASAVFRGSVTAYATDLKASILGVDAGVLDEVGAVHAEVARQMAIGVRRLCGADIGVATTGVAGPQPQDGRPVGTVFVAVAGQDSVEAEQCDFGAYPGDPAQDRARIQRLSTSAALELTLRYLDMRTGS